MNWFIERSKFILIQSSITLVNNIYRIIEIDRSITDIEVSYKSFTINIKVDPRIIITTKTL